MSFLRQSMNAGGIAVIVGLLGYLWLRHMVRHPEHLLGLHDRDRDGHDDCGW